jgi:acyl-coenzyme A synthetase/AMP-(fatty) acid ligase
MQGYWKLDDLTAKPCAVRSDGHYKTGDLVIEEDGRLTFLGRKDRLLKVRGYRLQPEEIEHVLQGHEDVLEAAVIAIREDGVENIAGLVATAKLEDELLTDLKSLCEELLPPYMVPSKIVRVHALPRNERGKVDFLTIQHLFSPEAEQNSRGPAREA